MTSSVADRALAPMSTSTSRPVTGPRAGGASSRRPRRRGRGVGGARVAAAPLALGVAVLAAGCESIPAPGTTITAQVMEAPRTRAELAGGYGHLYPALRAGVTRADAQGGRLVIAQCGEPDTAVRDGVRWHVVTTVLPPALKPTPGLLLDVEVPLAPDPVTGATSTPRRHGVVVAAAAAPDPAQMVPSAVGDSLRPVCQPPGSATGRWRVQFSRTVAPWEIDFAVAELARRDRFGDAEIGAGRVVLVGCQLKVIDGADWNRPTWLARAPAGVAPRVGDIVRVRAGASEMGKDVEPLSEVLGPAPGVSAPQGLAVVRCR
jgi:hypothetical protein